MDTEAPENQTSWAEAAWYDQAADRAEAASNYEPLRVQDSFHSPDFPLDLDAERSGAHDTAVHLDEEALPLIDSPEPLRVSEEADLVENRPNQRVDEEHETSNPEAMQLEAQEAEVDAESDSSSSSTSSSSESGVNEEVFNQSQSNSLMDPSKTVVAGAIFAEHKIQDVVQAEHKCQRSNHVWNQIICKSCKVGRNSLCMAQVLAMLQRRSFADQARRDQLHRQQAGQIQVDKGPRRSFDPILGQQLAKVAVSECLTRKSARGATLLSRQLDASHGLEASLLLLQLLSLA